MTVQARAPRRTARAFDPSILVIHGEDAHGKLPKREVIARAAKDTAVGVTGAKLPDPPVRECALARRVLPDGPSVQTITASHESPDGNAAKRGLMAGQERGQRLAVNVHDEASHGFHEVKPPRHRAGPATLASQCAPDNLAAELVWRSVTSISATHAAAYRHRLRMPVPCGGRAVQLLRQVTRNRP